MRNLVLAGVAAVVLVGCGGALPEPVYANQIDQYFPAPAAGADADAQATRTAAEQCATRLNGHRTTAKVGGILQAIFSGVGGVAGATGGVLSAIDFDDRSITTAMGILGAAGAGVTLIGNLVVGLVANPVKALHLHSEGSRSWDVAVELRYSGGSPQAIKEALGRCAKDEGPPIRVVGTGAAF